MTHLDESGKRASDESATDVRASHGPVLFIGLGAMGAPMSAHLSTAGFDVVLCDLRAEHAAALAGARGARSVPLESVEDAAGAVSEVVLMLPDSQAVGQVLERLLPRLRRGSLVIDMSSSRPSETVRLAAEADRRGIDLVDAPVSGGVPRAETAELSIMVGAQERSFERALPLLRTLGSQVAHVGPVGAGHAMKALNNLLSATGLLAASEVLAIGARFGLEPDVMLDVLNGSTGGNHATRVKMDRFVLSRRFDSGFSLQLMVKDLRTALDLAHETATPAPVSDRCLQEWTAAQAKLGPDADHTHIAAYVEGRTGTEFHRAARSDDSRFDEQGSE